MMKHRYYQVQPAVENLWFYTISIKCGEWRGKLMLLVEFKLALMMQL